MFPIIGIIIVTVCVIGGYLLEHGNMSVIFQPIELMIIGGAAIGSFVIASPIHVIKSVISSFLGMFTHSPRAKQDYIDILMLLNGIFYKIRQQGLVSIEADV
ncbi:MAG: flagellar motor stator protein MotA, partial [Syntrophaceae bacterium]|nr:flagellar motor stator protein MotA [Syntrophaceae bacterium]